MDHQLTDADLKATQPTGLVKLASAAQAIVGLFTALCGVQITDLQFHRYPMLAVLPYVMMAGGIAQILLASQVYRARPWAAYLAVGHGALMGLTLASWAVYSFGISFSCLLYITVPVSLLTVLLGVGALKPVRVAAAARARLAAEGLSLGL